MFKCQECGRKFRSVKAAERAVWNGCPGCGGSDIDMAPELRRRQFDDECHPDTIAEFDDYFSRT